MEMPDGEDTECYLQSDVQIGNHNNYGEPSGKETPRQIMVKSLKAFPLIEDVNELKPDKETSSNECSPRETEPDIAPLNSKQSMPESNDKNGLRIQDKKEKKAKAIPTHERDVSCKTEPDDSCLLIGIKNEILATRDPDHLRQLTERLRYRTTLKACSSFQDYVGNMKKGQKEIYFMIGRSFQELSTLTFVRRVVQAGFEVILMADPILDDRVVKRLCRRYNQFRLVAVDTENLVLPLLDQEEVKQKRKRHAKALKEFLPLCKRFKAIFPDNVQKIVISDMVEILKHTLTSCDKELIFIVIFQLVRESLAIVPCNGGSDATDVEPCFEINMGTGRLRLEINPDSHSLRSLCMRAALLDKKQEQLDSLIEFLVGFPMDQKPVLVEHSCSSAESASIDSSILVNNTSNCFE